MANPMETLKKAWQNPKGPGEGVREVGRVAKRVGKDLADVGSTVKKEATAIVKEAPGMIKKAWNDSKESTKKTMKMLDPNSSAANKARFKGYSNAYLKKKGEQIEKEL